MTGYFMGFCMVMCGYFYGLVCGYNLELLALLGDIFYGVYGLLIVAGSWY